MITIVTFAIAAMITYALRCSMVVLETRHTSSELAESAVAMVTPAVLTAIVASALLLDHGEFDPPDVVAAMSVAAAVLAVRRTSQVGLALAVGLPTYWIGNVAIDLAGFS